MNKCIVVIPVYKMQPSAVEAASFRQGLTILCKHPICLITYKELDISFYQNEANAHNVPLLVEYFDKEYFSSVAGYNKLCLTPDFYIRFQDYEYMLIYQTDAWVFRDELLEWCNKGYDFLGAPWFKPISKNDFSPIIVCSGNGGFNLRKISYCLSILNSDKSKPFLKRKFLFLWYADFILHMQRDIFWIKNILKMPFIFLAKCFGIGNTLGHYLEKFNEDLIFGYFASNSLQFNPKLPSENDAIKFAFEMFPSFLFERNEKQLPFGCHAFEKFEFNGFWEKHIEL